MIIGFTQRIKTVSESDAFERQLFINIYVDVATLRIAEKEHQMIFRLWYSNTAIVEPGDDLTNPLFDAAFGTRTGPSRPIQQELHLQPLQATIPPLTVRIRDDVIPEDEECFTIRIFPVDIESRHEQFLCIEDYSGATNYFCETTICIQDDDGKFYK